MATTLKMKVTFRDRNFPPRQEDIGIAGFSQLSVKRSLKATRVSNKLFAL